MGDQRTRNITLKKKQLLNTVQSETYGLFGVREIIII